jgi:chromosomal replication initiation ATPase DnaA
LFTGKVSLKGFRNAFYISSSFPKFPWRDPLFVRPEDLRKPNRSWNQSRARILIAHVLVRHGGFKVGEVAGYFGRDQTTISSLLSRFSQRAQQDTAVQAEVKRLAQIV